MFLCVLVKILANKFFLLSENSFLCFFFNFLILSIMLKVKDEIKIKLTFISSEVDKRKGKRTFTF